MNYELSEEQQMLKTMARDFLETECPEIFIREMEWDEDGYSPEQWRKIADLGWLGIVFPEKYDGTGGSILDLVILYEEMGRAMFPSPHLSTIVLCGLAILDAGSEEQKAEFLPKIVNGDLILALALTEPDASWGSEAWEAKGVTVPATAERDDYVINGTKLFVHDAHIADYLLVATRTSDRGASEAGITLFLVDAKSSGISHTLLKTRAGDNKLSEVVFDKVRVPKKNMVGELNGGWAPLFKAIQRGALMLCAEMVGAGGKLLELAVDYASTRIQFDAPIGIHQYVQQFCVDIVANVDSSKYLTYQAAWKMTENLPCDFEMAAAKAWASDAYEKACWNCHQVFGGVGHTTDQGLPPLYSMRGKRQQLYLGDSTYWLEKVAQQVDRWPAPPMPKGKPLGLWNTTDEEQIPVWQPWRERWDRIQQRKEEIRRNKAPKK